MKTTIINEYIKRFPALYQSNKDNSIYLFIDFSTAIKLDDYSVNYLQLFDFTRLPFGYFIELNQNTKKIPALYKINGETVLVYNYNAFEKFYEGCVLISENDNDVGAYTTFEKPLKIKSKLPNNTKVRFIQE